MSTSLSGMTKLILAVCAVVLWCASGCGPSQQEQMARDRLASARTLYARASADPHVGTYAAAPLADAANTINAAERAEEDEDMQQLAYLGERKTLIAIETARQKMAEQEQKTLSRELEQLRMLERTPPAQDPELERREERAAAAEERRQRRMGK